MGQSTDGQIGFGYSFDEDFEFPWHNDDGDIDAWWRKVNGFKHSVELYDDNGNYLKGVKPNTAALDAYYKEQRDWDNAHPLPVELQSHCSGDYPMYIIAVPRTCLSASRGEAVPFDPASLVVSDEQRKALDAFCRQFEIETDGEPRWYLTSLWS